MKLYCSNFISNYDNVNVCPTQLWHPWGQGSNLVNTGSHKCQTEGPVLSWKNEEEDTFNATVSSYPCLALYWHKYKLELFKINIWLWILSMKLIRVPFSIPPSIIPLSLYCLGSICLCLINHTLPSFILNV